MKFPDLAVTFRSIAKDGKDGFYKGRIAQVRFFGQFYMILRAQMRRLST